MNRTALVCFTVLAMLGCGTDAPVAPVAGPGWTGLTAPEEIIEARRLLMREAERQIKPIDFFTIGEPADIAALRSAAVTIEPLLLALPHLFPPTTNLFDATMLEPATIALPAIWENFTAFEAMVTTAETAVQAVAAAPDADSLKIAAQQLRAACDGCHVAFTKPYVRPVVTDADRNFDFESVLPQ